MMTRKQLISVGFLVLIAWTGILVFASCRKQSASELPVPPLVLEHPPASAHESLATLSAEEVPARDLVALAERYAGQVMPPRTVASPAVPAAGDVLTFWYLDHDAGHYAQTRASLVFQSQALNLWVEEGVRVNETEVRDAAEHLERSILPTNRMVFGDEWRPGVDGDPRLNVLHLEELGTGVVGYFVAADEFTTAVKEHSNERELLYVNLQYAPIGSDEYHELIAHEMQHMIHWHADSNEATWVNEGLAVLAAYLNNYPNSGYEEAFATNTDVQLNSFAYGNPLTSAHYGAAFYFHAYLYERYGAAAVRRLLQHPENGLVGVEAVLSEEEPPLSFNELFAEWVAANYLDSRDQAVGVYGYEGLELPDLRLAATVRSFPFEGTDAVHQFGADYIEIQSDQPVTVVFTGTQQTRLLDTMPHSGDYFWTTLPEDSSDMTLTGRFDLTGLEDATLTFRTWFEIEENWDYAYISVSPDDGETWVLLETEAMTRANPHGNNYGPAFTGNSGGVDMPAWIQQSADLSLFVGGPVLVRFEYLTDDATHAQGWALDDIEIPQLGFADDVEQENEHWLAAGFARHTNVLPQSFLVQLILLSKDSVQVDRLQLDKNRRGLWTLPMDSDRDTAILVISANTPFTSQRATYQYQVDR